MLIGLLEIVHVVRAHEGEVELARERQQPVVDDALLLDALVLHLQEEVARAEDLVVHPRGVAGALHLIGPDAGGDFALQTAAQPDQALRVRRQQRLVDARFVIEAVGVTRRHQFYEVVEPLVGLRQQDQVVRGLARRPGPIGAIAGSHIHFAAQDSD
jgi:hypothetical protein